MLRRFLLYLSAAAWARDMTTHFFLARRVARRFIAGETIDEALDTVRELNGQGMLASLDYLGESVERAEDTEHVVEMYLSLIERIQRDGLKAGVSLKLTHLGLDISEDLCIENLRQILSAAQPHDSPASQPNAVPASQPNAVPITIDMESSAYTDRTLRIYRTVRDKFGFKNVGTVIQAYLYRTKDDMRHLASEGATIRLCKGAYLEPDTVAFPEKADVDANYAMVAKDYLKAPPPAYLQLATHDEQMIQAAEAEIKALGLPPERFEFQMLYGIRSARQLELAQAGYQMRVYVPFGEAWYPYFMRRLAERPANLWFFARSIFRA